MIAANAFPVPDGHYVSPLKHCRHPECIARNLTCVTIHTPRKDTT